MLSHHFTKNEAEYYWHEQTQDKEQALYVIFKQKRAQSKFKDCWKGW